jgi:hypothetical protein
MIEKFLIRFCASEVRLMVARLHERPEDFDYGSKWRDLVMCKDGFTWAERKVLAKEWAKFKKNEKRREMLNLITKEVLDPTPKDKWGLYSHSTLYQQQLQNHIQQHQNIAAQNTVAQYIDPRALYGNPLQGVQPWK